MGLLRVRMKYLDERISCKKGSLLPSVCAATAFCSANINYTVSRCRPDRLSKFKSCERIQSTYHELAASQMQMEMEKLL